MEEQKRGPLEQAASTAHTIHGAIKTGRAIARAAKGAAAGGQTVLNPGSTATRAECAQMLTRFFSKGSEQ